MYFALWRIDLVYSSMCVFIFGLQVHLENRSEIKRSEWMILLRKIDRILISH